VARFPVMDLSTRVEDLRPAEPLVHPGAVLLNEWMAPRDFSQNGLARRLGVPPRRINEIVLGKRGISADTAIGLAAVFGTTERYWMSLQADYELAVARRRRELLERAAARREDAARDLLGE
jgi:addiction module HigA family antidote